VESYFTYLKYDFSLDLFYTLYIFFIAVGGNENFEMKWACLTLCGLTQPAIALPLIMDKNNVAKRPGFPISPDISKTSYKQLCLSKHQSECRV